MITFLGIVGAVFMLVSYVLVTTSRISGDGMAFQLLNLAGSVGLMINAAYHAALPSAVLNFIWIGIGIVAVARLRRTKSTGQAALRRTGGVWSNSPGEVESVPDQAPAMQAAVAEPRDALASCRG